MRTSSASDWACIFSMMCARWNLTVRSDVAELAGDLLVQQPRTTSAKTSRSQAVGRSYRWRSASVSRRASCDALSRSIAARIAASRSRDHRLGQELDGAVLHRAPTWGCCRDR
jgi:hypothetical protein